MPRKPKLVKPHKSGCGYYNNRRGRTPLTKCRITGEQCFYECDPVEATCRTAHEHDLLLKAEEARDADNK